MSRSPASRRSLLGRRSSLCFISTSPQDRPSNASWFRLSIRRHRRRARGRDVVLHGMRHAAVLSSQRPCGCATQHTRIRVMLANGPTRWNVHAHRLSLTCGGLVAPAPQRCGSMEAASRTWRNPLEHIVRSPRGLLGWLSRPWLRERRADGTSRDAEPARGHRVQLLGTCVLLSGALACPDGAGGPGSADTRLDRQSTPGGERRSAERWRRLRRGRRRRAMRHGDGALR